MTSNDVDAQIHAELAMLRTSMTVMVILGRPMSEEMVDRWLAKIDALMVRAAYLSDVEPVYP